MTGVVGAIVEAWDELRIHRLRVLLALLGVAAAVCAITGITAAADMMNQALREQAERDSGRDTTLMINAWTDGMDPTVVQPTTEQYEAAYAQLVERYDIEYATRDTWSQLTIRFPDGAAYADGHVVDPDYGVIHRVQTEEGRWFTDDDVARLAPALVVNEAFLERLAVSDLSSHPTVLITGATPVRATIVGVMADRYPDEPPSTFILYDHFSRWVTRPADNGQVWPSLSVWVPPDVVDPVTEAVKRDLAASLPGTQVDVYPSGGGYGFLDGATRWVITGMAGFTLLLGGLGLLNISLVTVRYRIREIGIRRSFGATSGRVFFGVLMESVVATVVAGAVGVMGAVAVMRNLPVERVFGIAVQDIPSFPVSAAVLGMACATAVGGLAGLIPALVAVRVKVIDAIRY